MGPLLRGLFDVEPEFVKPSDAELIGIGSILDAYFRLGGDSKLEYFWKRLSRRPLHVWGSGFMTSSAPAAWPQKLHVHAVRGDLSRNKLDLDRTSVALGDPAILLPLIWPKSATSSHAVTVVPHFSTYRVFMDRYGQDLPKNWRVVNLLGNPQSITEMISSSEVVVSSSLHGLIVADAYGIPTIWMHPEVPIKGDGFKFDDYFSFRGGAVIGPFTFQQIIRDWSTLVPSDGRAPSESQLKRLIAAFPL